MNLIVRTILLQVLLLSSMIIPLYAQSLAPVPPVDLATLKPSDFADDELDLPYYLKHFHTVANAVVDKGELRGFLDLPVWRSVSVNKSYNARIMESHLSLAFFYCTKRPWNPYYGHPAVRERLEAMLKRWCDMQNDDGQFSEYAPNKWALAPTAFATKFMGQTLTLLSDGPSIDKELLERVARADANAIHATLTRPELYKHGRSYSNQFANIWGGALAYLALYPDAKIEQLLDARLDQSMKDLQSPAGYFYERDGPDWGYNMNTHHSDVEMAWAYSSGTARGDLFVEKMDLWYDWLAHNAPPEPDGSGFFLNRAVETRQRKAFFRPRSIRTGGESHLMPMEIPPSSLASKVVDARAFSLSKIERKEAIAVVRTALEEAWPEVPEMDLEGRTRLFSPYAFLHRDHGKWFPTAEEKAAAMAKLPCLGADRFTHQRVDSRKKIMFTYVRRPAYYAAFNAGEIINSGQRYGLGLLWTPGAGAVLQSQTASTTAAWGTLALGMTNVYEATTLEADFSMSGGRLDEPGIRDLLNGALEVRYRLAEQGDKRILFGEDRIEVTIMHRGEFEEIIPLLTEETDLIDKNQGGVRIRMGREAILIDFGSTTKATITKTGTLLSEKKSLTIVKLASKNMLTYTIVFQGQGL